MVNTGSGVKVPSLIIGCRLADLKKSADKVKELCQQRRGGTRGFASEALS